MDIVRQGPHGLVIVSSEDAVEIQSDADEGTDGPEIVPLIPDRPQDGNDQRQNRGEDRAEPRQNLPCRINNADTDGAEQGGCRGDRHQNQRQVLLRRDAEEPHGDDDEHNGSDKNR